MRYLVTGGSGFIGSHLVDRLVERGDEVVVLDNLSTGNLSNLDRSIDEIKFVSGSILDGLLVDELIEQVDVVVHLAAAVGVELVVERPLHSFITNIRGSETVLEAAHRYRKLVLLASTSEIYGKTTKVPFKEDDDRVLGSNAVSRWGYATSKAADEILAFAYYREKHLPTIVVRLFNTVGPRQSSSYGMVVPRFVEHAIANEPLPVYGTGKQTRCFCHVSDVVEGLLRLLEDERAYGDVFNLGSQEEISMADLAKKVIARTGSTSEIRMIPYEEAYESGFEDMMRRVPDISKIEQLVGWEPKRTLEEILDEVTDERRSLPHS